MGFRFSSPRYLADVVRNPQLAPDGIRDAQHWALDHFKVDVHIPIALKERRAREIERIRERERLL